MKYWNSIFCIIPVTRTHATSVCMGHSLKYCYDTFLVITNNCQFYLLADVQIFSR